MTLPHTKFLLVEGKDDQFAVAGLLGHFVKWGGNEEEWPVKIEVAGDVNTLLSEKYLSAQLKRSGLAGLGIMADANDSFPARWQHIRELFLSHATMPADLPAGGLVEHSAEGFALGVWIMPDNGRRGMLETFCAYLVPPEAEGLWEYAQGSAGDASGRGAPYRPAHRDKANIHTYLAWQDPPGQPLGGALTQKLLDPASPAAKPFVEWFIKLFDLGGIRLA